MLHFMVTLFTFFWLTTYDIWSCASGDIQTFPLQTTKTCERDVLHMCQDRGGHVGWNRLRSHCTTTEFINNLYIYILKEVDYKDIFFNKYVC